MGSGALALLDEEEREEDEVEVVVAEWWLSQNSTQRINSLARGWWLSEVRSRLVNVSKVPSPVWVPKTAGQRAPVPTPLSPSPARTESSPLDPRRATRAFQYYIADSKQCSLRPDVYVAKADDCYHFDAQELNRVQRKLKQRHVQMIAVTGTIGTGLFLGSGSALSGAGPLKALIAYAVVGSVAYSALCAIGEMTSHAPISGTFPHFAARWVDPALGFVLGWNYWYSNAISTPVEITAATILISFWDSDLKHQAAYTAVICVLISLINIFVLLITGLILTGLVIDLGGGPDHDRRGLRYWKKPSAVGSAGLEPNHIGVNRFLGILTVFVQAGFSFQGMELAAIGSPR
ncbi:amino acid permease-domain-containing protein [Cytidiella melzeri]|nr:amino acid permease-domain-containing protein [Cytidiella melzeri]